MAPCACFVCGRNGPLSLCYVISITHRVEEVIQAYFCGACLPNCGHWTFTSFPDEDYMRVCGFDMVKRRVVYLDASDSDDDTDDDDDYNN